MEISLLNVPGNEFGKILLEKCLITMTVNWRLLLIYLMCRSDAQANFYLWATEISIYMSPLFTDGDFVLERSGIPT